MLSAIGDLKDEEINYWLKIHIGYAQPIYENPFMIITRSFRIYINQVSNDYFALD